MTPAYCISLAQTPERRQIAIEHFKRRRVDVRIFDGVHGWSWGICTEQWTHDKRDAGNWIIPPGHVGLNLSHWMLWAHLWQSGIKEAIVLEDDAVLPKDFMAKFKALRERLPADWQLWHLGTVGGNHHDGVTPASAMTFGTHAYLVNRDALPILLREVQSGQDHIDILVSRSSVKRYSSELVTQRTADGQWSGCCHKPYRPEENMRREIAVEVSQEMQGWCPPEKAAAIYDGIMELSRKFANPTCIELGVWGGMSLIPAGLALRDAKKGHLVGIDPYTKDAAIEGLGTQGDEGRHCKAWADGTYGEYVAARDGCLLAIRDNGLGPWCSLLTVMPDAVAGGWREIHYMHVDDNHSERASCRNVETWMPKLAKGGLLVLDDCCWPTVKKARAKIASVMRCREDLSDHSPGRRWEVYENC